MKTFIAGAATLLATLPSAYALGSANVVNNCGSAAYLWNTPSAGGGGVEVDKTLGPGTSYSQTYQALTNGNGWSLKLAPTNNLGTVMQFEYTYQNAGVLWYDISYVNGDPFNGNWVISSDSASCVPKQTYYRYSTDNANGMQAGCSPDVSITVTLCPGGSGAAAPATTAAPVAAPAAPVLSTTVATQAGPEVPAFGAVGNGAAAVANIFTTFVTQVVTVDYTAIARRAAQPTGEAKRDVHQHQHHHRHQHAHV